MANTFIRKTHREIGNTLTQIDSYTVGGSTKATVIGLSVANTSGSSVDVDVTVNDGSNDFYLIKNCPLPSGSTVVVVGGDQKLVLEPNDLIKARSSSNTNKIDVVMSILEIT